MTVELLAGERAHGESSKAIQACNDYLRMGPARSIRELHRQYVNTNQSESVSPTNSLSTLLKWSTRYGWQERAALHDERLEQRKTAEAEAVMQEGLALPHERVRVLKELAENLQPFVVAERTKHGQEMRTVDPSIVAQLRGVLDDIAKETGGRAIKQEVTGANGEALTFVFTRREEG